MGVFFICFKNKVGGRILLTYTENKGLEIIYFIATGLMKLEKQVEEKSLFYPYPNELRIGLDKLAVLSIEKNIEYPKNITDAIKLFHIPIKQWGVIDTNIFKDDETLMEDGQLSDTCIDFSMKYKDVETELTERLILNVMSLCKAEGKPEDYVKFRRKISENPFMKKQDVVSFSIEKINCCASDMFKNAYEEIPLSAIHEGKCYVCSHCGWIIEWRDNIPRCDSPLCKEYTDYFKKVKVIEENPKNIMRLKRGVHRFIARPAIHELLLEKKLLKLGLEVQLWPNYDAYDLKIVFPDGEIWAVDVKDWANPYLLAKSIDVFNEEPFWDKAFYVVPQYRKKHCRDYKKIFKNNFEKQKSIYMDMENEFIKKVKDKLW
jgi:hypothetical protein